MAGDISDVHYELGMLHRSGEVLRIEAHGSVTMYEGQKAIIGTMLDVTSRKRTEAKLLATHGMLQHLLDHSPAVLYSLSIEDGRVTPRVVSENIFRLLAFTVEEACSYDWWTAHLHPEDAARAIESVQETIAGRGLSIEYRIRHRDGHYLWVEDKRSTLYDVEGRAVEIVGVWADVTERKQMEEVARQRAAELERFHRLSVGRELRMVELKKEINELSVLAGRVPPYASPSTDEEGAGKERA